jgi:excinuclease UvrABC nuclease subunit
MSIATRAVPTVTFKGASDRTYTLWVYELGTDFDPNQPAVYVVMREYSPEQYVVIYIGQTEDLAARFEDHHKRQCMARHQANVIAVRVERDEAERLAIENDLIVAYNPPCNG